MYSIALKYIILIWKIKEADGQLSYEFTRKDNLEMRRVKVGIIGLSLLLVGAVFPCESFAGNIGNVEYQGSNTSISKSDINKKIERIAKYTGYKKQNFVYYKEMTVEGEKCSAFECIDDNGFEADYLILIYDDGKIIGYDVDGKFIDVKAKTKNTNQSAKVEYTIKKDKIEYKDKSGKIRGVVYYQYPQFKGTSSSIKKINNALKKESSKFLKSENVKTVKESTEYAIENNSFYDKKEQYFWKTSCKVSYNKNNIVSFYMNEEWYAGGVYNKSEYGLNYNIKTGKTLTINNVISGDAKKKILAAAKKYCGSDKRIYNIIKNTKNYKFYFSKGKVYICYGSYELGRGDSWDKFSVVGKYK